MQLYCNGKLKARCGWGFNFQEENGFCIKYHNNGVISKIGIKTLGNFSNTFAEFHNNGGVKFQRERLGNHYAEEKDKFGEKGMLFYQDGS